MASVAKLPYRSTRYRCPNPGCQKYFATIKSCRQHCAMSKQCCLFVQQLMQDKSFGSLVESNKPRTRSSSAKIDPLPIDDHILTVDDETMDVPVEDSINDESVTTNTESVSTKSVAHTDGLYHETKLLQILDKVQAPHYLFQEIMEWSQQAKLKNYSFRPERKTQTAQILHLKKLVKVSKDL